MLRIPAGRAVVPDIGKGYAGSRDKQAVLVFDLKTFAVLKTIAVGEDTDAGAGGWCLLSRSGRAAMAARSIRSGGGFSARPAGPEVSR